MYNRKRNYNTLLFTVATIGQLLRSLQEYLYIKFRRRLYVSSASGLTPTPQIIFSSNDVKKLADDSSVAETLMISKVHPEESTSTTSATVKVPMDLIINGCATTDHPSNSVRMNKDDTLIDDQQPSIEYQHRSSKRLLLVNAFALSDANQQESSVWNSRFCPEESIAKVTAKIPASIAELMLSGCATPIRPLTNSSGIKEFNGNVPITRFIYKAPIPSIERQHRSPSKSISLGCRSILANLPGHLRKRQRKIFGMFKKKPAPAVNVGVVREVSNIPRL